jgi:lipoprotein-releasing system permease protein
MLFQIGVFPDINDRVHLISPFGGVGPLGDPIPKRREYSVIGGFKSGFFEYDVKYVLMSLQEAYRLLGAQGRYGLQIMINDPAEVPRFEKNLRKFLGSTYDVSSWTAKNKRLFAALKLEKVAMTFLLFLIIVIASFSIVGVTLMIFFSKRRDLAVLMAIGASRKKIEQIFLIHGGLIGLAGAIIGLILGLAVCLIVARSGIVLPASYYLDYLPVSINPLVVLLIVFGGVAISLIAAYYPARRAAATDPIELLRCE